MLHGKKTNNLIFNWLVLTLSTILIMIVVGGLTRLTDSGLSITEWELIKGILPPLNEKQWSVYFELYKKIPQFKLINSDMTLNDFKVIFYWEYFHRILGRLIGIIFIIPLLYFHLIKRVKIQNLYLLYFVAVLILIQGAIGWYMVQSGLVNNVTVSHYRLSLHLILALIIISILFWQILNLKYEKNKNFLNFKLTNIPYLILISLIFIQIVLGAFVSGLDAGKIYQTWPLMGLNYFPNDLIITNLFNLLNFDNHSLVQFYHRNTAYLVALYILVLNYMILKKKKFRIFTPSILLIVIVILQVFLGIFTLISNLNIYLASSHQILSVILILSALYLYYSMIK